MSIVQEKMYMDVDDVCAILGVSKAYAYNLMREYIFFFLLIRQLVFLRNFFHYQ